MAPIGDANFSRIIGPAPAEELATIARPWVRWRCEAPGCGKPLKINGRFCEQHATDERERWRAAAVATARDSIPLRYREHRFADVEAQCKKATPDERWVKDGRAFAAARKSVNQMQLMLQGPSGHGKSTIAGCICNAILDLATPGCGDSVAARAAGLFWVRAAALQQARREWKLGGGEAPLVARSARASVLIIDDFGREAEPGVREQSAVAEVIFERHEQHRQTVVTTWLSPHEAAERYDGGTARRIFEDTFLIEIR
jgi:DNA replication protein DnaC